MSISYNQETMERFMKEDIYLRYMVKDLMTRGHSKEDAMQITFNSAIIDDGLMMWKYQSMGE